MHIVAHKRFACAAFFLAFGAIYSFHEGIALAQPKTKIIVSAADAAEASKLYQEGIALGEKGEFSKSAEAFESAYRKGKNAKALFNQSTSERKGGHPALALVTLYKFLDVADSSDVPSAMRTQAEKELAELKGLVCTYVVVGPPGTTAMINGQPMRRESGYAEPGAVVVELTVGPMKRKRESTCKAGEQKVASFDDVPVAPSTATPAAGMVVTEPGFGPVKPPEVVVPPKMESATSRSGGLLVAAIGTGVLGVGGTVLGGVLGSQSTSAAEERTALARSATEPCVPTTNPNCKSFKDLADTASSRHTLSIVSFAAGGAMLGASVLFTVLYLGSEKPVEGSKVARRPKLHVAPTLNGLMAFGQF